MLRELDTLGRFSAIFTRETTFVTSGSLSCSICHGLAVHLHYHLMVKTDGSDQTMDEQSNLLPIYSEDSKLNVL